MRKGRLFRLAEPLPAPALPRGPRPGLPTSLPTHPAALVAPRLALGGVFPLPTVMLSLIDQLLVTSPLLGCKLGIDLGAHARLDGIEPRPDPSPEGIGLGAVTRED